MMVKIGVAGVTMDRQMYRHILIATDGSDLAKGAVAQGLALAKALGAQVTAVTVTEPVPIASAEGRMVLPPAEYLRAAEAGAVHILDQVSAAARTAGVQCETIHVKD